MTGRRPIQLSREAELTEAGQSVHLRYGIGCRRMATRPGDSGRGATIWLRFFADEAPCESGGASASLRKDLANR